MVIHAIDFACDKKTSDTFVGGTNSYVSVWLTNYIAWEPDGNLTQSNDPPSVVNTELDGSSLDYYRGGVWRFDWSESKAQLLDNLEGQANAYCDWYRIRWHECDHDEDDDRGCSWDEVRSDGPVPGGIP